MTATLADRYVAATVRTLPPALHAEVRDELDASIADAVAARIAQGESPDAAERAVLTELGDPDVLAAGYADRPLHLIGPKHYLAWWRLLRLLLWIVPACAMGGVALGQIIAEASLGEVIGQAVVVGIGTVVHLCFWVTLVFVVLERTGTDTLTDWDVDHLPEPQQTGTGRSELVAALVFLAAAAGAILWDHFRGFAVVAGDGVPVLEPDLWPWWIAGLFVLMGAEAAVAIAVWGTGRWTRTLAAVNTVLAVVFTVPVLALLAAGQLVNPAFLELVFRGNGVDGDAVTVLAALLALGIVAGAVWDVFDGWRKALRSDRPR